MEFLRQKIDIFKQRWKSPIQVEGTKNKVLQYEWYIVTTQNVMVWNNPLISIMALIIANLVFYYVWNSQNTVISWIAWCLFLFFVMHTWLERIWPEIRVEPETDEEDWTPVYPNVLSAPELQTLLSRFHGKCICLVNSFFVLRREKPGKFVLISSSLMVFLIILGQYLSTALLIYILLISAITLPALIRITYKHPLCEKLFKNLNSFIQHFQKAKVNEIEEFIPESNEENTKILDHALRLVSYNSNENDTEDHSLSQNSFCGNISEMPDPDEIDKSNEIVNEADLQISNANVIDESSDEEFIPTKDNMSLQFVSNHYNGNKTTLLYEGVGQRIVESVSNAAQSLIYTSQSSNKEITYKEEDLLLHETDLADFEMISEDDLN